MNKTEQTEILNRIKLQILIRLFLIILSIFVILIRGAEHTQTKPFNISYLLLIAVCIVNLIYVLLLSKLRALERFALFQTLFDTFWITILIYLTGGVLSNFVSFYFFAILTSALLVNTRATLLVACFSIIGLCFVSLAYFLAEHFQLKLLAVDTFWISSFGGNPNFILAYLLAQVISFALVAWLGSYLMMSITQVRIVSEEILDSMADGVITFNRIGRLVFMNQKARELLGIPQSKRLEGDTLEHLSILNQSNKNFWDLFERGEKLTREITVQNHLQKETSVKVTISFIFGVNNKMRGLVGVISDLTLFKRVEQAMTLANKLKGIEELAAGIAHEIRNPLTSIRGAIQELQEEFQDRNELFNIALKESDRLNRIVTEFVHFAHVKKLKTAPVEIDVLLNEVVDLLQFQYKTLPIQWEIQCRAHLKMQGDETQLRQLFFNLIINAIESLAFQGKIQIRAYYSPSEDFLSFTPQEGIQIEIEDDGRGLTEEEQKQIFIPFYTTKKGGTGLGLGIVYRIVKAHEGDIKVRSVFGRGTTMIVWLPC